MTTLIAFAIFCVGIAVGKILEAHRWRENAQDYRRIESWGRLFKVHEEKS